LSRTPGLAHFDAKDLPDLTGRRVLVTGANSGIGFHASRALADHGAEVVLGCRNLDSGREAAVKMPGITTVEELDLASQKSIQSFVDRFEGPLDVLVNNAGVMTPPSYRESQEGHELQFGTNHLGHFALTGLLLPFLLSTESPRVVTIASIAHHRGDESVLEGNPAASYDPNKAYGNSKLANLLFAHELHRRATRAGSRLTSVACHPGVSATNLVGSPDGMGANAIVRRSAWLFMPLLFQSSTSGANPTLYAATYAEPDSYVGPTRLMESRGRLGEARQSRHARDAELARRLWEISEQRTGVSFDLTT
jgi:NAD(P)-dependent dehydrogenase (short-subunit alcohol dehydrogenase family)